MLYFLVWLWAWTVPLCNIKEINMYKINDRINVPEKSLHHESAGKLLGGDR